MPTRNSKKATTLEDAMVALEEHQMLDGRYKTFDPIVSEDETQMDIDEPASIHVMKHIVRNSIQHLQPYYTHRRHSASRSQSIISVMPQNIGRSARNSIVMSEEDDETDDNNVLLLSKLRKRFEFKQLEPLYQRYQQRMMHVNLKAYLYNQMFLCVAYIIILLAANAKDDVTVVIPEVLGQVVLFLVVFFFAVLACNENLFRRYSWLHCATAIFISIVLVAVDVSLCFWFDGAIVHVSATFYTILVVYNLLPLTWIWQSLVLGIFISLTHVLIWILVVTPSVDSNDINSIMADTVFLLSANLIGIFAKSLHEITLRRTFLERRKCIDSTIRYEYEKSREEKLMMSILPKHIASEVREDIREEIQQMLINHKPTNTTNKPFEKLYVKKYSDVTILFADIVNFTPLTALLPSAVLVAMLNELFGQFDDAAKANHCLRIKILGDCYNCVSGIPEPNVEHAKNCVETGLKMIKIIKQIREEWHIDVDMRIGVHSGSVISGLLGLRKWQFDIWSRDVTIANHMEQSGIPGRVHVSMATKNLLGDSFKVEPGDGGKRDSFLSKLEIDTFLILPENHDETDGGRKITFQDTFINHHLCISTDDSTAGPSSDYSSRRATNTDSETSTLPLVSESTITKTSSETNDNIDHTSDDEQDKMSTCSDPYVRRPSTWVENSYDNKRNNSEGFPRGLHFPLIITPSKKGKKTSFQIGDDQHEEIYSRVTARKSSHNVRRSVAAGAVAGKALSKRRSRAVPVGLSVDSFRQMMGEANTKMEHAIETMHLNKFRQASLPEQQQWKINFFLYFSRWDWELPFLNRKDPLFKLYIIGVLPVLLGVGAIQIFLTIHLKFFWTAFGVSLGVAVLVALFLWSPVIRNWVTKRCNDIKGHDGEYLEDNTVKTTETVDYGSSSINEEVMSSIRKPPCWTRFKAIRELLIVRLLVFLVVIVSVGAITVVDLDMVISSSNDNVSKTISHDLCYENDPRIYLWYFTYSCALTMTAIFGFYRIHFLVKFVSYVTAVAVYSLAINTQYSEICMKLENCLSCQFSPSLHPEIVHILYLICILVILHVTDRQIEFIHRLDYVWKRQLVKEREEANTTRTVNQLLLLNVLPLHVAEVYLDTSRPNDELYHENYKYVAVMFASMPNFMDQYYDKYGDDYGLHCLGILNQIISEFDALTCEGPFTRIEKIKLIGTTYMAACGLASTNNSSCSRKGSTSSIINESSTISSMTAAGVSTDFGATFSGSPLSVLVRFSAAMTGILGKLTKKLSHHYQLRIGIDYGPAIAGVVGAQKPFYDIWGDTVNMASRLESTGELGKIQVTERTARLIESEGILCERRGETYLKGKGLVVTHWVHPHKSSFYDLILPSNSNQNLSLTPNQSLLFSPILETTMTNRSPSVSLVGNLLRNRPPAVPEEDELDCENVPELSDSINPSEIVIKPNSIKSDSDKDSMTNL